MKYLKFLLLGIFFGIVGTKSEFVSWFRIHEMFHFESFHMYGIIGSSVVIGAVVIFLVKKSGIKSVDGDKLEYKPLEKKSISRFLGGSIFGFGWALTGACPGPIYILIGNGYLVFIIVWLSAVAGTFVYGLMKPWLPH